jgi:hypothetical protein
MAKPQCVDCGKPTLRIHPILDIPLCAGCQREDQDKYRYITKTRAMEHYRLRPSDLATLGVHEVDNPHYKIAAPMQLYLLTQIEALAQRKWGSKEPYIVALDEIHRRIDRVVPGRPRSSQAIIAREIPILGGGSSREFGNT